MYVTAFIDAGDSTERPQHAGVETLGLDACRGKWLGGGLDEKGFAGEYIEKDAATLPAGLPGAVVVGVNIPIGLPASPFARQTGLPVRSSASVVPACFRPCRGEFWRRLPTSRSLRELLARHRIRHLD